MGIGREEALQVLEEIAVSMAEQYSSKPSPDALVKRALAQRDAVLKAIAARLAEKGESLSGPELEFIVQYAPEIAGRAAPALLQAALKTGAGYIVDALRDLWAIHGNPTKAPCPRCGFKSLTPDYTCIVCGSSVSEEEFKSHIGFESLLKRWAEHVPRELVEEALRAGYVYYEDDEILAPSQPGSPLRIQVFLSRREKEALRELVASSRKGETRASTSY
jgi:DNA-directed RNA polymerase subunit RPC12/RpoP